MRLLVVEDEVQLAATLKAGLEAEGFEVELSGDGRDGLWRALAEDFDAVVLDYMLPSLSGAEVVERLRHHGVQAPVLILTSVADEQVIASTLDVGADDYLTKPFSFVVLLARLRALLRRTAPAADSQLLVGSLSLDRDRMTVSRRGEALELTPREFRLLERFMDSPAVVLSKQQLLEEVWGEGSDAPVNVVEVYVGYLRRKIDAPYGLASLTTVRGFGYRLDPTE